MRTLLSRALLTSMVFGVTAQAQQKTACSDCIAKLLIVVDQASTVRVDGQSVGALAAGDSKLVRVGVGAHLVEAKASDATWSTTVRIEKPGQEIVKTDIVHARDQARAMAAAAKWDGEWVGSTSYSKEEGVFFTAYHEQITFRVSKAGNCTVKGDRTFYNDYQRDGEFMADVRQRVTASARTRNSGSNSYACETTPEGGIHSVLGDVSPNGDLTFVQTWEPHERVTVRLTDPASARQAEVQAASESKNAASEARQRLLEPWIGAWRGDASRQDPDDNGRTWETAISLTIRVDSNGECSAQDDWSERRLGSSVEPRVVNSTDQCRVLDARRLRVVGIGDVIQVSDGRASLRFTGMGGPMTISLRR